MAETVGGKDRKQVSMTGQAGKYFKGPTFPHVFTHIVEIQPFNQVVSPCFTPTHYTPINILMRTSLL